MIYKIIIESTKKFEKQKKKLPNRIQEAIEVWIFTIKQIGLAETRKLKGYHDESLQGDRFGQRTVRLNRAYRLFYTYIKQENRIILLEVNKHAY